MSAPKISPLLHLEALLPNIGWDFQGETVDLSTSEELKSVTIGANETLIVTLYKNGHWGAGGGNLTGISLDHSSDKPAAKP